MYKTGLFVGKFLPPHIGHKWAIIDASKQCEKLIVLVGHKSNVTEACCREMDVPFITLEQKTEWFKQEFKEYPNIEIIPLDEEKVPVSVQNDTTTKCVYSKWAEWSQLVKDTLNTNIDVIFGSEISYAESYNKYFPNSKYVIQDASRDNNKISSTMIRQNLKKYFNYIMPSAKSFFKEYIDKN